MQVRSWRCGLSRCGLALAVGGAALSLCTGCGADSGAATDRPSRRAPGPVSAATPGVKTTAPARRLTMQQLGAALSCAPQQRGRSTDYQQAICAAPSGKYVINTFTTDRGQREWLDYSMRYGGTYLVGQRWIIVSSPELLTPLRARLGGQIQTPQSPAPPQPTIS